ncbi:uncharacterized protein LOC113358140 [Papaver somniferum]|uniref:uncharacterized protein LOC113358140 n=1 Tax=Papaver somniferum TaxID=3469 RepID=UPI000E6FB0FC|nr:uncharacterized protein LOC113358140 [Papaver somniferum]
MCKVELETTKHLLFHCPYAKEVWNLSPNPTSLSLNTSSTILDLCKNWINKPTSDISIELLLTKMWFIWKERCDRVFEDKAKSTNCLALEIQRHVDFWSTRKKKNVKYKQVQHKKSTPNWKTPCQNTIKINVDADWISDSVPSSFGLILRNNAGDSEGGRAGPLESSDPQEAEAIGVLQAATWAKEKQIKNFST